MKNEKENNQEVSILITGVAGFIGTNLASQFINQGKRVVGLDNLCRGSRLNIEHLISNDRFSFIEVDLSSLNHYRIAVELEISKYPITEVWHLAANSDILAGVHDAQVDLRDTFMTTFNTLEIMKEFGIDTIAFASSSAIYGNLGEVSLTEDIGPLFPISNYGAMKLASEALISAALENFLSHAFIFRFPNVIGVPATHGVIFDFINKLKTTPDKLNVLGDGSQQKSYLHVDDLIDAMLYIRENSIDHLNYFNISAGDSGISVQEIAKQVVAAFSPNASIAYGQGNKGWIGDVPKFHYSVDKLKNLGWKPRMNSINAVHHTVQLIANQESARKS
jgi:UDP-glucose 4-epimerase